MKDLRLDYVAHFEAQDSDCRAYLSRCHPAMFPIILRGILVEDVSLLIVRNRQPFTTGNIRKYDHSVTLTDGAVQYIDKVTNNRRRRGREDRDIWVAPWGQIRNLALTSAGLYLYGEASSLYERTRIATSPLYNFIAHSRRQLNFRLTIFSPNSRNCDHFLSSPVFHADYY